MSTEATHYAAEIKHYNYVIYVDVVANDRESMLHHLQAAHLECSSKQVSQTLWRIAFQPGTEFDAVAAAIRQYDELRGPTPRHPK